MRAITTVITKPVVSVEPFAEPVRTYIVYQNLRADANICVRILQLAAAEFPYTRVHLHEPDGTRRANRQRVAG